MWVNDEASVSPSNEDVNLDGGADEWGVSIVGGERRGQRWASCISEVACG